MLSQISVFLVVLLFTGLKCLESDPQMAVPPTAPAESPIQTPPDTTDENPPQDDTCVCGTWYAVMATGTNDGGPCNILTNNVSPCECMSAYIVPLQTYGLLLYTNAVNNQSSTLTVDMGGASETVDNPTVLKAFTYSRLMMPLSVLEEEEYVSEKVCGMGNFMQFEITILALNEENFYMITQVTLSSGGNPIIIVWSRKKTPGKNTLWKAILDNLYALNMNPHDLEFINQIGCKYPSPNQYNEMLFCTSSPS